MTEHPHKSDQMLPEDQNPAKSGRVLVVDDESNIRSTLNMVLSSEGYNVDLAEDGASAEKILSTTPPDIILLDVRLPGQSGLELLPKWLKNHGPVPIIMMSGEATLEEAFQGLKAGAYDFLEKPLVEERVLNGIERALEKTQLLSAKLPDGDEIVGESPPLHEMLNDIKKLAPLKTRVLVTGESGTGKDLVARALHNMSARKDKNFVKINCAAIPHSLIESELFGHIKGAFTGALKARKGLFESAHGGTLFLDEVGELSSSAQAKILRTLQNGEITPVGSNLSIQVDVRIICATNRDLKAEVEEGAFREDLYYRLAVVTIETPALRSRLEDIPLLAEHFAKSICQENGLKTKQFDAPVIQALQNYPWPGNIRELRNVIERLIILSGPIITLRDLPEEIRQGALRNSPSQISLSSSSPSTSLSAEAPFTPMSWEAFKAQSERQFLIDTLRHCDGNISESARLLKVERSTVHKWMKSHQIQKQDFLI